MSKQRDQVTRRRRPRFEQLETRHLLSASELVCRLDDPSAAEGEAAAENRWHNSTVAEDVNADNYVSPVDFLLIANDLNERGSRLLVAAEGEDSPTQASPYVDVSDDRYVSPLDALLVANALNAEAEGGGDYTIKPSEVEALLKRAAAASASEDFIIAIVDRGGRILGIRAENDVLTEFKIGEADERTEEFVFAIDGAVAKARTAAFFANGAFDEKVQELILAPLTSRTVRFVSQSTITQREVESNPNIADLDSTVRGPGFVGPIGLGGHFPPEIPHTPPVDLFAIEHTNRDSVKHAGLDAVIGTPDDIDLLTRFGAPFLAGKEVEAPESYGVTSKRFPDARPRGIGTLPGGIPLYKTNPKSGALELAGGIGVFAPGPNGYASHEQNFVPGIGQTEAERTNAPQVLESEWIAFAAACGSAGANATVGELGGTACPVGYDLPFGRIDLVGITLEIYGPHPTAARPQSGIATLQATGAAVGLGDPDSGADQIVTPGVFYRPGVTVPDEWLVGPLDSPLGEISKEEVETIIEQAIVEADLVRAGIRLRIIDGQPIPGARTKMVFSVADREGNVLGLYRMPDATFFSIDVAVAKARNTAYHADATAIVEADRVDDNRDGVPDANVPAGVAFTNRTYRFLSEPRYPSGVEDSQPGAFSILLDPGINPVTGENIGPALPASVYSSASTSVLGFDAFNPGRNFRDPDEPEHQNGIVFFPGSSPIYNDAGELIGGFGASGDGVDQDDVVTFSATVGFKPPNDLRADQFFVRDVRLPFQKFLRNPRG
jgi:uncharacterized protein GlcG (DUF336 family)